MQRLFKAGVFGPGSDLWLIPSLESSSWSHLIDWYLNFQLTKSRDHKLPKVSEPLKNLLKEIEMPEPKSIATNSLPLLIASENLLPNQQVIEVTEQQDIDSWVHEAQNIWESMKRPSVRVFLPSFVSEKDFKARWPKGTDSTTYVLEN